MTKKDYFSFCMAAFKVSPDYPFEGDFESAVLRHKDSGKWFALVMNVSRRKFGLNSDELVDVVNLKIPVEMNGSFRPMDGVYPAYHMNKLHWVSVLLCDAPAEVIKLLTGISFTVTQSKGKKR